LVARKLVAAACIVQSMPINTPEHTHMHIPMHINMNTPMPIPIAHAHVQEGDGLSPTAIREILLLRELRHEHIVKLTAVHINRSEPSLSLAFDYAEHDLYEIIWHHRDRLAGGD
jgi:serine/threonine protein kinase